MRSSKPRKAGAAGRQAGSHSDEKSKTSASAHSVDWKDDGLALKDVLDPYWSWRVIRMNR
jgi:hypothetical protein